ncbi:MAG TPA: hypothetical protein VLY82_04430 [Nitrososphaerales archaeon]|nr:hypothetical protein [Nitrososphaerales archaeon]
MQPAAGGVLTLAHDCLDKATEIRRRTSIILGLDAHDVVNEMCGEWGVSNADEFYRYMRGLSDDELRAFMQESWKRIANATLLRATSGHGYIVKFNDVTMPFEDLRYRPLDTGFALDRQP